MLTENVAVAFVPQIRSSNTVLTRISRTRSKPTSQKSTQLQIVWDPRSIDNDSGLVDFPTPSQRTEIKKEAKRRAARRKLQYFSFSDEESYGPWSPETFQESWSLLTQYEMIQLKGICRDDKKQVYTTAKLFCEAMEELIATSQSYDDEDGDETSESEEPEFILPVALLSVKGHTALIYCPTLPVAHPDKFQLRTSVGQKNIWSARPKPLRDNSGQIIKSRKEVMEMYEQMMEDE